MLSTFDAMAMSEPHHVIVGPARQSWAGSQPTLPAWRLYMMPLFRDCVYKTASTIPYPEQEELMIRLGPYH